MAPKNRKKPTATRPIAKRKSQNKIWFAIVLIALIVLSVGIYLSVGVNQPSTFPPTKVKFETTAGDIIIDLRTDKPITSSNFANLVRDGRYDGSTFHRTIETFMIQGGKVSGNVPVIPDEIGSNNHNTNYTIAMANAGPNTATSEFFINTANNSPIVYPDGTRFDASYTVFGTVIEGKDVVDAIAKAPVTADTHTGEMSVPVNPVTILHATIVP